MALRLPTFTYEVRAIIFGKFKYKLLNLALFREYNKVKAMLHLQGNVRNQRPFESKMLSNIDPHHVPL